MWQTSAILTSYFIEYRGSTETSMLQCISFLHISSADCPQYSRLISDTFKNGFSICVQKQNGTSCNKMYALDHIYNGTF